VFILPAFPFPLHPSEKPGGGAERGKRKAFGVHLEPISDSEAKTNRKTCTVLKPVLI